MPVSRTGSGSTRSTDLRRPLEALPAVLDAVRASRRSIDMLSFLRGAGDVTREVADALAERARAGVRVRLLLEASGSHGASSPRVRLPARFREALTATARRGVQVQVLTNGPPGAAAMVGTANLDARSYALNQQIALLLLDPAVTAVLDQHVDADLAASRRATPEAWRSRGIRQRLTATAADLAGRPLRGLGAEGLRGARP